MSPYNRIYSLEHTAEIINTELELIGKEIISSENIRYWRSKNYLNYDKSKKHKDLKISRIALDEIKDFVFHIKKLQISPHSVAIVKQYIQDKIKEHDKEQQHKSSISKGKGDI